ncbi:lysosomal acid phosphatase-like protein 3 [Leptotrombidium deliense]|uniref:acid phosphatase n=1 Tax=Leptotrombidium deliense TaxID=299467 RepID=A0A443SLE7_9ACAR|nr:lysosomal acid phosphatase-like protein 3 [Leptotrombidium deliense]
MTAKVNLVLFVLIICLNAHTSSAVLKAVFIIHRHGDRTPIKAYKNDPYGNDTNWIEGWGQLTAKGKRRMYNLGRFFRKRYGDFLTNSPREVFIRSSAAERCLESAQMLVNGIYAPHGAWIWSEDQRWLPFPIQTEPRFTDGMMNPESVCPIAKNEQNRIRQSPEVLKWQETYKDLFNYLSLNTGESVKDMFAAEKVYDTLRIQKENNLKLPEWVNEKVMTKLRKITSQTFCFEYSTRIIHRLRAGLFLNELRQRFKDIIEQKTPTITRRQIPSAEIATLGRKLFIYSTHDTFIAILLHALGAFNMMSPPYGSSIIFELHSDGEHIIKSFYINETQTEIVHPLKISGCSDGENCKLGEFLHATEELIPENWKRECGLSSEENSIGSSGTTSHKDKHTQSQNKVGRKTEL